MNGMSKLTEDYFRYIPVRQRDEQWGLYVTGAGRTSIPAGREYPPHTHPELYQFDWASGRTLPEYQAIYITRGEGVFESATTGVRQIAKGTIVLLFPGVWHRYRPLSETGWDEWWVSFNGETIDRLVERKFFSPADAVLPIGMRPPILAQFESLIERMRGEEQGFPHLLAADVMELLAAVSAAAERESAELIAQGPQNVLTVKDRMVAEAMRLIWQKSHRPMTVDSLARQLPITRRSLERRFHAAVGHGIHAEIVRCRLERAKRLLVGTDLLLKQVAASAGFTSADGMNRLFRRVEGLTPLEYRRRNSM